ncbi:hypothetical protein RCL_jg13510.t1 [Rhizophagus clarus]|uniref:Uncharacterized protein n=1 Tax=Rhizophagus clarus TaxID=94130 RepID=A0A8H3LKR0_9GLOM|nr:hypothetical protein RCL_jg13510.t1 [Rhizophagus clarus]
MSIWSAERQVPDSISRNKFSNLLTLPDSISKVLSSDHFLEHGSMMGFIWWCFKFEGIRTRQLIIFLALFTLVVNVFIVLKIHDRLRTNDSNDGKLETYGKKILYFLERSDDVVPPHTSCPFKSLPSDLSDPYTILRIQLQSLDGCWSNSFILNMARTTF